MSPQSTRTPTIITAMPGAGRVSLGGSRRPSPAIGVVPRAVTTPARISRIPTDSHAQWSVDGAAFASGSARAGFVRPRTRREHYSWTIGPLPYCSNLPAPRVDNGCWRASGD